MEAITSGWIHERDSACYEWTQRLHFGKDCDSFFDISPVNSDRGNFLLHLVLSKEERVSDLRSFDVCRSAPDNRHFPRYFFSGKNARSEVESWIIRSEVHPSGKPFYPIDVGGITWESCGKDCTVQLLEIMHTPNRPHGCGDYLASVKVHPGLVSCFTVDAPDLFPRLFFSEAIAIEELTAWLKRRNQI
jgi:hypothetical protein